MMEQSDDVMNKTIHAVYQGGVFRPVEQVDIADGARVELTVRPEGGEAGNGTAIDAAALLEIASLPPEGPQDNFSGADHDGVLYGDRDAR